jgi:hypothetical protein
MACFVNPDGTITCDDGLAASLAVEIDNFFQKSNSKETNPLGDWRSASAKTANQLATVEAKLGGTPMVILLVPVGELQAQIP